jgi:hypothetical protein
MDPFDRVEPLAVELVRGGEPAIRSFREILPKDWNTSTSLHDEPD